MNFERSYTVDEVMQICDTILKYMITVMHDNFPTRQTH